MVGETEHADNRSYGGHDSPSQGTNNGTKTEQGTGTSGGCGPLRGFGSRSFKTTGAPLRGVVPSGSVQMGNYQGVLFECPKSESPADYSMGTEGIPPRVANVLSGIRRGLVHPHPSGLGWILDDREDGYSDWLFVTKRVSQLVRLGLVELPGDGVTDGEESKIRLTKAGLQAICTCGPTVEQTPPEGTLY